MLADGSDRAIVVEFIETKYPGATVQSSYPIMLCPYSGERGYTIRFTDADGAERRCNVKSVRGQGLVFDREVTQPDRRHSNEWPHKPREHGEISTGPQAPGYIAMGQFYTA